jgi:hypothetical protein
MQPTRTRTDHKVVSAATWSIVTWAEWRIRIEIPRPSKPKPRLPHLFVLEALATLNPEVRRMFSEWAVYVGNRLIMMLRDHARNPQDNGVWLVLSEGTDPTNTDLRQDLPSLRPIQGLGSKIGHWLLLPADDAEFEREALHACDLILSHDPRLGRIPQSRR